ncbi:SCP-like protein [Ancylostoma duodenale]|uniref:SCP-like protein n=1 Tax=Ancylostoma duodenale TaxID=51022 RepID=A0A0C2C0F8_9BILA|nr:SCP-like protein [Ancylostoma duodenale]
MLLGLLQITFTSGTTKFGCKNSLISDEWREKVYTLHNTYRRRLAKGEQPGKDNIMLPVSKDTQLMHWDCTMEEMAEAAAKDCPARPKIPIIPGTNDNFGAIFQSTNAKGRECNPVTTTDTVIKAWWKKGAQKQENQNRLKDNDKFAQMAYSASKGLGCTYQTCAKQFYVLCFYGQKYVTFNCFGNTSSLTNTSHSAVTMVNEGNPLYTATQQDEVCGDCKNNAAGQLQCENALCNPPYTPSK